MVKWILFAILVGSAVGFVGTAFCLGMNLVLSRRESHGWLLFLLPFAAVLIQFLYRVFRKRNVTYSASGTWLSICQKMTSWLRVAPSM